MAGTPERHRVEIAAAAALVGWLVVLLALTLSPNPGRGQGLNLTPGGGLAYDRALWNLAINVVLFLPLGVLAPAGSMWLRSAIRVLAVAALLSVGIEAIQWYAGLGRQADVNDVLANVAGAGLGYLAGRPVFGRLAEGAPGSRAPGAQ